MTTSITVIDYGMGNLDSVRRALEECGAKARIVSSPNEIGDTAGIVLPGVGAFPVGMKNLIERGFDKVLKEEVFTKKRPFLGICLGMQLLADHGQEGGLTDGLGWIPGEVRRLSETEQNERIPHVGWNEVHLKDSGHPLFKNLRNQLDFYFVHSYHFASASPKSILATTPYAGTFNSVVGLDRVFGVQFHPEKSQKAGFQLLRNFVEICRA